MAARDYTVVMKKDAALALGAALIAIAFGTYFFLSGDLSDAPTDLGADGPAAVVVPFEKVMQGSQSKVSRRVNYLITSPAELAELWKLIDATATPPAVNFATDAVVAVFAGEKPTTGHAVTVSKIEDADAARTVFITLTEPDADCIVGQAQTAPYEIVTVPVTALPLAHEDSTSTVGCTD